MSRATFHLRSTAARLRVTADDFKTRRADTSDRLAGLLLNAFADAFELGAREGATPDELRAEILTATAATMARLVEAEGRAMCDCGRCFGPEGQAVLREFAVALGSQLDLSVKGAPSDQAPSTGMVQ